MKVDSPEPSIDQSGPQANGLEVTKQKQIEENPATSQSHIGAGWQLITHIVVIFQVRELMRAVLRLDGQNLPQLTVRVKKHALKKLQHLHADGYQEQKLSQIDADTMTMVVKGLSQCQYPHRGEPNLAGRDAVTALKDAVYGEANSVQGILELAAYTSVERARLFHWGCSALLRASCTAQHCFRLMDLGQAIGCYTLEEHARMVAIANFSAALQLDPAMWKELSFSCIASLVPCSNLQAESETQIWEAILSWVGHQPTRRMQHLPDLIDAGVRLDTMSTAELLSMMHHPLVAGDTGAQQRLANAYTTKVMGPQLQALQNGALASSAAAAAAGPPAASTAANTADEDTTTVPSAAPAQTGSSQLNEAARAVQAVPSAQPPQATPAVPAAASQAGSTQLYDAARAAHTLPAVQLPSSSPLKQADVPSISGTNGSKPPTSQLPGTGASASSLPAPSIPWRRPLGDVLGSGVGAEASKVQMAPPVPPTHGQSLLPKAIQPLSSLPILPLNSTKLNNAWRPPLPPAAVALSLSAPALTAAAAKGLEQPAGTAATVSDPGLPKLLVPNLKPPAPTNWMRPPLGASPTIGTPSAAAAQAPLLQLREPGSLPAQTASVLGSSVLGASTGTGSTTSPATAPGSSMDFSNSQPLISTYTSMLNAILMESTPTAINTTPKSNVPSISNSASAARDVKDLGVASHLGIVGLSPSIKFEQSLSMASASQGLGQPVSSFKSELSLADLPQTQPLSRNDSWTNAAARPQTGPPTISALSEHATVAGAASAQGGVDAARAGTLPVSTLGIQGLIDASRLNNPLLSGATTRGIEDAAPKTGLLAGNTGAQGAIDAARAGYLSVSTASAQAVSNAARVGSSSGDTAGTLGVTDPARAGRQLAGAAGMQGEVDAARMGSAYTSQTGGILAGTFETQRGTDASRLGSLPAGTTGMQGVIDSARAGSQSAVSAAAQSTTEAARVAETSSGTQATIDGTGAGNPSASTSGTQGVVDAARAANLYALTSTQRVIDAAQAALRLAVATGTQADRAGSLSVPSVAVPITLPDGNSGSAHVIPANLPSSAMHTAFESTQLAKAVINAPAPTASTLQHIAGTASEPYKSADAVTNAPSAGTSRAPAQIQVPIRTGLLSSSMQSIFSPNAILDPTQQASSLALRLPSAFFEAGTDSLQLPSVETMPAVGGSGSSNQREDLENSEAKRRKLES